jgi:hypothetical protein
LKIYTLESKTDLGELIEATWGITYMGRSKPNEGKDSITPRDRNITFERGTDFLVPYNEENINRCKCPLCPVQADSQCVRNRLQISKQELENAPEGVAPNPENVPGVYCSEGRTSCQDLEFDRQCICDSCEVWNEYVLKDANPNNHFCQQGRAT